jgi:hypothetical protein
VKIAPVQGGVFYTRPGCQISIGNQNHHNKYKEKTVPQGLIPNRFFTQEDKIHPKGQCKGQKDQGGVIPLEKCGKNEGTSQSSGDEDKYQSFDRQVPAGKIGPKNLPGKKNSIRYCEKKEDFFQGKRPDVDSQCVQGVKCPKMTFCKIIPDKKRKTAGCHGRKDFGPVLPEADLSIKTQGKRSCQNQNIEEQVFTPHRSSGVASAYLPGRLFRPDTNGCVLPKN